MTGKGSSKSKATAVVAPTETEVEVTTVVDNRISVSTPADLVKLVRDDITKEKDGKTGLGLNLKEVKSVCDSLIRNILEKVVSGDTVSFTNNFTFKRAQRGDRTHKNPKTGEEIFKKAHYVLAMDVKPALKKHFEAIEVVAGGSAETQVEAVDAQDNE